MLLGSDNSYQVSRKGRVHLSVRESRGGGGGGVVGVGDNCMSNVLSQLIRGLLIYVAMDLAMVDDAILDGPARNCRPILVTTSMKFLTNVLERKSLSAYKFTLIHCHAIRQLSGGVALVCRR